MKSRETVERIVLASIQDVTLHQLGDIHPDDRLIADLRMDSDDFSFVFVRMLERALSVKTTQEDWDKVITVGQIVDMLHRLTLEHVASSDATTKALHEDE